ncbi:MAG: hypothetical protein HKM06_09935, partial [Spirochaetales bacterium]|nr:hypothetical protein [Spirochaetales bacterium]
MNQSRSGFSTVALAIILILLFAQTLACSPPVGNTTAPTGAQTTGVPAAASALSATLADSASVLLSWKAAAGTVSSYDIYWATSNSVPAQPQGSAPSSATSYTASGLTAGSTYWFWVAPKNSAGSGPSVSASLYFGVPAAVTNLQAMAASTSSVQLSWSFSNTQAAAQGFEVFWSTTSTQPSAPNLQLTLSQALQTGTACSWTVSGLASGASYNFWVASSNVVGSSAPLMASGTPNAVPAPVVLTATGGPSTISLAWTDVANSGLKPPVLNYLVYWSTTSLIPATPNATLSPSTLNYVPSGLSAFTNYYFWVKASNSAGVSAATVQSAMMGSVPATPVSLSATASLTSFAVALAWAAPADTVTEYDVFYGVHPTAFASATPVAQNPLPATARAINLTSLGEGTTYDIYLVAKNLLGSCATPASVSVTTGARPALVSGLSASQGAGSLQLSWTPSAGATDYVVYYAPHQATPPSVAGTGAIKIDTGATLGSYTITGLGGGTSWDIWVEADNSWGNRGQVLLANQTAGSSASVTSPVTGLTVAATGSGIPLTVSWSAPADGSATG